MDCNYHFYRYHRTQAEGLLSNISRHFLDQDLDTAINFTLEAIAKFIEAERSCIYTYSDDRQECYLTYEWNADCLEAIPSVVRATSVEQFKELHQQLFQGKAMQFSSLAETPLNATAIGILAATSTQSFAIVPMRHSGQVVGLLVASVVHYSKTWSQEEI
ncbi:MAG TPA: hypothetical protein DC064_18445, partial [Cyanobacteria bacterium UBA9273]|nr:hypothetical protein [Cyanobacteria bacterium UBA9273]